MSQASPPTEEEPYPPARYSWYVVSILMIVYIFSFVDRQILSLLVSDLKTGLNLTRDWHAGFLMGPAFAVFYALCGVPFGRLADQMTRRTLVAIGLTLWSMFTVGCGVAKNFTQMALLRVGVGVGEASLSPSAYSMITDSFPCEKLGTAIGFYTMGIYFGSGMAYMVGGPAVDLVRETAPWNLPIFGLVQPWQKVFFLVGLPGLIFVPILLLTVREPLRRGVSKAKGAAKAVPVAEVVAYLKDNWKTMLCHNVGFALLSFSNYGTGAWLPTLYNRIHGWSAGEFGLPYGMIVCVFGALGIFTGGWFADILRRRGKLDGNIRVGFVAAWIWFPFGIVYPLLDSPWLAMVLLAGSVYTSSMPHGVAPAAIQEMMPNRMRGQASSIYLLIVNMIGLAVGPLTLALMTDYVFTEADFGLEGIRYSLLATTITAHLASSWLLWKGMVYYRESLKYRERYEAA